MTKENKEWFWIGWVWSGIVFFIGLMIQTHLFPSEFEKNGRKKLCQSKHYEYCNNEELINYVNKK